VERTDAELDNVIAKLGIAEYQENKLRRILASRLDKSNPVAFSKRSSMFAFRSGARVYNITVEVDTIDTGHRLKTAYSISNALRSPVFIITSILFSAIICGLTFLSMYGSSPALGTFSGREVGMLDKQYALILDRCDGFMNEDQPNPRSFGAQYSTCNKAIVQLQAFCKEYHTATCEDQRMELYLSGNGPNA
ncbi:MAG TPA: hypothetical protein VJ695_00430, partial [Nitrososphaera sp.]|nr:hypothetical protein [Nitrososphaera sp.]